MQDLLETFRALTDEQLLAEGPGLAERERTATATLVAWLAEIEARTLYVAQGFTSLRDYCIESLHLSEGAAHRRIRAARAALRFPLVLARLADGSVTLTNVTLLAPSMTEENHAALLDAARHKSRREVEEQVAALHPGRERLLTVVVRMPPVTFAKLRAAQDLLRQSVPTGDVAEVFDRALTVLVHTLQRDKLAQVERPRRARNAALSGRHVPASVKRAVVARDEGRCAFVGPRGRCGSKGKLEFHHVTPFADGGQPTLDNIQLRCRVHNTYEAEREFGLPSWARQQQPSAGRRKRVPSG
jgi:5-methylcytosine-specific restriction endonuclease McrA